MYVNARAIIERGSGEETEVLLQVAARPDHAPSLEFPGGRLEEFEPILDALRREVIEETGLRVTHVLGPANQALAESAEAAVECLTPFCVYQTVRGPVDSTGFFFRCHAEGELLQVGDGAYGHRWVRVDDLEREFTRAPEQFHWLTQGALRFYLQWRRTQ
jgi:8-oxo-dGTP pyrophosphatase MutT (NUDIX family)